MKIIINRENFRPKMALDLENYRGKYVCAQEILILDWRLRRGDIYEVSGDIKYDDFAFNLALSLLQSCVRGKSLTWSFPLTGFLENLTIAS